MNKLFILEKRMGLLKESFEAGVIDAEEYRRNKEKVEREIEKFRQQEQDEAQQKAGENTAPTEKQAPPEIMPSKETPAEDQTESRQGREEDEAKREMAQQAPITPPTEPTGEAALEQTSEEQSIPDVSSHEDRKEHEELSNQGAIDKDKQEINLLIEEAESKPAAEDKSPYVFPTSSPSSQQKQEKKTNNHTLRTILLVAGAIVALVILIYFSINLGQMSPDETLSEKETQEPIIACYQHADCALLGKESKCINAGTVESSCLYQNATAVKLTLIGGGECASCSTERIKNILVAWFPGVQVREIPSSSSEGKALRSTHAIAMLPAYILDANIEKTLLFDDVKSALRKSGDSYVVKDGASGAPLFLTRNEVAKRLDVFLAPEDESSRRAVLNMEEFAGAFANEVDIVYHAVKLSNASKDAACVAQLAPQKAAEFLLCAATSDEDCISSLGIDASAIRFCVEEESEDFIKKNTALQNSLGVQVPSFLINNRMRLGGVQAADTLREQYCSMNDAPACSKELRKSLV